MNPRLARLGTTIFTEMTALARAHGAINLAQGSPDFAAAEPLHAALAEVLAAREAPSDQYAPMPGHPDLQRAVAAALHRRDGLERDPAREVLVGCGATELLYAAITALGSPGDEIVLFEPFYDAYWAAAELAGLTVRTVRLAPPHFRITADAVAAALSARTRLILLNTPHNPTGRIFGEDELAIVARAAEQTSATVVSDEVYEHLVYDTPFLPFAPRLPARTLTIGSASKTFSATGWRVGWLSGPSELVGAVRGLHQYVTFAAPTVLQRAVAAALATGDAYFPTLRADFGRKRQKLGDALERLGYDVYWPDGAYFICAGHPRLAAETDVEFCRRLTTEVGVAAIPPSAFYADRSPQPYVRFTFCKTDATLDAAIQRLGTS